MLVGESFPLNVLSQLGLRKWIYFVLVPNLYFFSAENVTRPIRNHFLQRQAISHIRELHCSDDWTTDKRKLFGKDSAFIELLVSVFPDI